MGADRGEWTKARGRPRKLSAEQVEALIDLVRRRPTLSMEDLVSAFRQETGIRLAAATVKNYLEDAGFTRPRAPLGRRGAKITRSMSPAPGATAESSSYGYTAAHRDPGDSARYPCGLTDSEWEQVRHLFDPPGRTGRPEKYPRRQMVDACIYVLRSGCSWRMLPKDFPPWTVVYKTFRRWQARGLFEAMYKELRELWRDRQHRPPEPTHVILDSQSVKTSPQGGPKGYDAAKKIKGRKRHLVTDTLGLLIAVMVTAANVQDRDAALPAIGLARERVPGIQKLYADSGYEGKRAREIQDQYAIEVEIVRPPSNRRSGIWHEGQLPLFQPSQTFKPLPKRWIIERTNAWNERPRRMNKDHDRNLAVSEAWIWLTEGRMLLRRLTTPATPTAA
jgi:putative transposase